MVTAATEGKRRAEFEARFRASNALRDQVDALTAHIKAIVVNLPRERRTAGFEAMRNCIEDLERLARDDEATSH